jgi:hypothetical protein
MGQLRGDDATVVLVSPGEHLIEASATVGAASFHTKLDIEKVEKTVDIQLKSPNKPQAKIQEAEPTRTPAQADAARRSTWTDPATGLMWTKEDNGSDVDWEQARVYCSKLGLAGYSDWRLPTTEELKGIYDPFISTQKMFDTGAIFDVHVKGNLTLTGRTWSGSKGTNEAQWEFTFGTRPQQISSLDNPFLNFTHFNFDMRALCVRSAGE